jgi:hypothetical protein
MADLYHDDAEQAALDHAERIFDARLEAELSKKLTSTEPADDARSTVTYVPSVLMKPQTIMHSDEALETIMQSAEYNRCVLCIFPFGNITRVSGYTGTDTVEGQIMRWTLRAQMAFVAPDPKGPYRAPRRSGRLETQREFTRRLARIYRDALSDVMMKHLQGAAGIQTVTHVTKASDTSYDKNQIIGRAWGDMLITQSMLIPKPLHQIGG